MRFFRSLEVIFLGIAALAAVVLSILDTFNILGVHTYLVGFNYEKTVLFLIGALTLFHLSREFSDKTRFDKITNLQKDLDRKLGGARVKTFADPAEMEDFLARAIDDAKVEICDLTWKKQIKPEFSMPRRVKSHKGYERSLDAATSRLKVREVFILNDPRRKEKMFRRIENTKGGYSASYFENDESIPRIQFIIIDRSQAIFFSISDTAPLVLVDGEEAVAVFQSYFDEVWRSSVKIKEGDVLHQEVLERIRSSK